MSPGYLTALIVSMAGCLLGGILVGRYLRLSRAHSFAYGLVLAAIVMTTSLLAQTTYS